MLNYHKKVKLHNFNPLPASKLVPSLYLKPKTATVPLAVPTQRRYRSLPPQTMPIGDSDESDSELASQSSCEQIADEFEEPPCFENYTLESSCH